MLTVYRRHRAGCKHRSRRYKKCFCPIWVQGVLRGKRIRHSLDVTNWEAAQRIARDMEIHGEAVSVKDACDRWIKDCEARNLKPQSLKKYKNVSEELKKEFGPLPVRGVSVDDLRRLRESWKHSGTTTRKRLELMRGFFSFCVSSAWLQTNPAKLLKHPQARPSPTLPYTEEEWKNLLTAADVYGEIHPQSPEPMRRKLKALLLLMRYSGLRISDAVGLKRDRIDKSGRLFVYTQKTGKPVYLPLPQTVIDAIDAADEGNSYLFWSGLEKLKTAITDWQDRLQKVRKIAGIKGKGGAHRLRDSFSTDLLTHGVPIETVAAILGNSVKVVEKHYSPWIESRQAALEESVAKVWA